jgi:predicted Zn-ribbon and HTH transcriptional regulator
MAKNIAKTELRDKVLKVLQESAEPLTLAEISAKVGVKINSGTTNVLVAEGILVNGEDKMVEVVKKEPRKTYAIGDITKYGKAE